MIIFVGNLSLQATDKDLLKLVSQYAEVKLLKVMTDNVTRRSRGCAFVQIEERSEADNVIAQLHNTKFIDRVLVVCEASAKHPLRNNFITAGSKL